MALQTWCTYLQAEDSLTPVKSATVSKKEPEARYLNAMYNVEGAGIALFLKQTKN